MVLESLFRKGWKCEVGHVPARGGGWTRGPLGKAGRCSCETGEDREKIQPQRQLFLQH